MQVKINEIERTADGSFIFYKAFSYRWEETPDPVREDLQYFLRPKDALEYATNLKPSLGFYPTVEKYLSLISDVDIEEGQEELDLSGIDVWETLVLFEGEKNVGEDIQGSIIIEWGYEKYPGYARNLKDIGIAGEPRFHRIAKEVDLITGNEESTFGTNYSVLLSKDEIEDVCEDADLLLEKIEQELYNGKWKWNYFKNNPKSPHIRSKIEDIIKELTI